MFGIKRSERNVAGVTVNSMEREFYIGDLQLKVEVGTNGFKDDDSRCFVRFEIERGRGNAGLVKDENGSVTGVVFCIASEEGPTAITKSLDFMKQALVNMMLSEAIKELKEEAANIELEEESIFR